MSLRFQFLVDRGYIYMAIEGRSVYAALGYYEFADVFRGGLSKYFCLRSAQSVSIVICVVHCKKSCQSCFYFL